MRSLYFLFFCTTFSVVVQAQFTQGQIVYENKVDMHRNIPDERAHLKEMIPPYRTSQHILQFTPKESYFYRKAEEISADEDINSARRRRWTRRMGGGQDEVKLYTDLATRVSLESREFFGKKFLISGEANDFKWKFTGDSKQVGSYFCQKAIHTDTTGTIVVWFTPMIPVPAGPENYTGLPGLILHVDINEGERIITALEVNNIEISPDAIIKPTEGEPITRKDYRIMTREKMKEMEDEYGGQSSRRRMWHRG